MIIYNITYSVDYDIEAVWRLWMKEKHVLDVLGTGKFLSARFSKIETGLQEGGNSYSIQFLCESKAILETYLKEDAPALIIEVQQKFAGKLATFKTEMEMIEEFFYQTN